MDPEILSRQELDETLVELRQFNAQRKVEFWIKVSNIVSHFLFHFALI